MYNMKTKNKIFYLFKKQRINLKGTIAQSGKMKQWQVVISELQASLINI